MLSRIQQRVLDIVRGVVALWMLLLLIAAFAPPPPSPPRPPPDPCGVGWREWLEITRTLTSEEMVKVIQDRCTEKGVAITADQPAGENWLMRHRNVLLEEARRGNYKKVREHFIAAELQQDFRKRHAALTTLLELADTPLLRHRVHIEIARSALRSGDQQAITLAAEAASAAHREAQSLPKPARADAYVIEAEIALRAGAHRQARRLLARAVNDDQAYLAAHLLRLDLIARVSGQLSEDEKLACLDEGLASARFVRVLTNKTYVVDARNSIAEQYPRSDVAVFLQFLLGSLADDREGTKQAIGVFLTQCGSAFPCSAHVRTRAQELRDAL